jgi:rRNA maturation protein Rpf1
MIKIFNRFQPTLVDEVARQLREMEFQALDAARHKEHYAALEIAATQGIGRLRAQFNKLTATKGAQDA